MTVSDTGPAQRNLFSLLPETSGRRRDKDTACLQKQQQKKICAVSHEARTGQSLWSRRQLWTSTCVLPPVSSQLKGFLCLVLTRACTHSCICRSRQQTCMKTCRHVQSAEMRRRAFVRASQQRSLCTCTLNNGCLNVEKEVLCVLRQPTALPSRRRPQHGRLMTDAVIKPADRAHSSSLELQMRSSFTRVPSFRSS